METELGTQHEVLLEVDSLRTEFPTDAGWLAAVKDVSFDVCKGEIVGLVGESGSGKSATIRSFLGLLQPPGRVVGGSARFRGIELIGSGDKILRPLRGDAIGYVPQNPFGALNPILRVEKQFYNVLRAHRKVSRSNARDIARSSLREVGIRAADSVLDGYAHQLSGGMAQRVVIALAMANDPSLIVADEPTTALDLTVQRQILDLINDLVVGSDRSLLLVTHDLGVVAQYCQRMLVLYRGELVEQGSVHHVFRNPSHHHTRSLVNSVATTWRHASTDAVES